MTSNMTYHRYSIDTLMRLRHNRRYHLKEIPYSMSDAKRLKEDFYSTNVVGVHPSQPQAITSTRMRSTDNKSPWWSRAHKGPTSFPQYGYGSSNTPQDENLDISESDHSARHRMIQPIQVSNMRSRVSKNGQVCAQAKFDPYNLRCFPPGSRIIRIEPGMPIPKGAIPLPFKFEEVYRPRIISRIPTSSHEMRTKWPNTQSSKPIKNNDYAENALDMPTNATWVNSPGDVGGRKPFDKTSGAFSAYVEGTLKESLDPIPNSTSSCESNSASSDSSEDYSIQIQIAAN